MRLTLGDRPASPRPDPPHLYGRTSVQSRLQKRGGKPEEEVVAVAVPPLINLEIFEAVQKRLHVNNLKVTPPRAVSGPDSLTGILLRQLRWGDDAAHRQERPLSLLCLRDPVAAGRHRLQRPRDPNG